MISFSLKQDVIELSIWRFKLSGLFFKLLQSVDRFVQNSVQSLTLVLVLGSFFFQLLQLKIKSKLLWSKGFCSAIVAIRCFFQFICWRPSKRRFRLICSHTFFWGWSFISQCHQYGRWLCGFAFLSYQLRFSCLKCFFYWHQFWFCVRFLPFPFRRAAWHILIRYWRLHR